MHFSPATLLFALPTLSSALVPRWHQSGSFEVDVSKVISTTNIPTNEIIKSGAKQIYVEVTTPNTLDAVAYLNPDSSVVFDATGHAPSDAEDIAVAVQGQEPLYYSFADYYLKNSSSITRAGSALMYNGLVIFSLANEGEALVHLVP